MHLPLRYIIPTIRWVRLIKHMQIGKAKQGNHIDVDTLTGFDNIHVNLLRFLCVLYHFTKHAKSHYREEVAFVFSILLVSVFNVKANCPMLNLFD